MTKGHFPYRIRKDSFIDTEYYHNLSHGGNLHCLFKQIFKIPAPTPASALTTKGGSRSRKKLKTKSKKRTKYRRYRRYRNSRKKQLGKRKSKTTSKNRKSKKSIKLRI